MPLLEAEDHLRAFTIVEVIIQQVMEATIPVALAVRIEGDIIQILELVTITVRTNEQNRINIIDNY